MYNTHFPILRVQIKILCLKFTDEKNSTKGMHMQYKIRNIAIRILYYSTNSNFKFIVVPLTRLPPYYTYTHVQVNYLNPANIFLAVRILVQVFKISWNATNAQVNTGNSSSLVIARWVKSVRLNADKSETLNQGYRVRHRSFAASESANRTKIISFRIRYSYIMINDGYTNFNYHC